MTGAARHRQTRALTAALLLSVGGFLPVTMTGALAVQIRQALSISGTWIGVLVAAYFLAGGALSPVIGTTVDRAGWRRSSVVVALASAGALLAVAVVVTNQWLAVLVLATAGAAMSASVSTSNLVLAQEMPGHRLGVLLGVKQSSIPVAGLASGLAVPLIGLTLGWRWAFALAVVVPVAAAAAVRTIPATTGPPAGAAPEETGAATDAEATDATDVGRDVPTPLSPTPRLRIVAIGSGLASVTPGVLTGFTVITAVDAGMDEAASGALLAVGSVLGIVVRVVSGWRMDQTDRDGFRGVAVLLALGTVGAGLLATGRLELLVPGVLLAFAGGWGWPAMFFYEVIRDHPTAPAAATGRVQGPSMVFSAVGPIGFGWLTDTAGVSTAWTVTAGFAAAASVVLTVAARQARPDDSLGASGGGAMSPADTS